jgi:hypothetical protein
VNKHTLSFIVTAHSCSLRATTACGRGGGRGKQQQYPLHLQLLTCRRGY